MRNKLSRLISTIVCGGLLGCTTFWLNGVGGIGRQPGQAFGQLPAAADSSVDKPSPAAVDSPLKPDESLAAFRLQPGLRVELVAAEPLVESPVALAFDARGRMFVAENRGYPTGPADAGRIVLLEDADGDGRCDRRTVFAEGLSYPNGLMPWRGGLIVTCAPDLLFLEDTDGDGRCDRRQVLFTGFSTAGSTQLRCSHPQLGLDNWIYVTGGLTGGKVTSPDFPDHPPVEFQRADFRFRPDSGEFEAADGGGQFGMTFDDFGHRFICYNRVQVQHVVLPSRYLRRNPHLVFSNSVQDCPAEMLAEQLRGHGAAARIYPISSNITTADSHAGTFTAACGLMIFRGVALHGYVGDAFSCDPTANLVHVDRLEPAGATFSARSLSADTEYSETEFLASPDNWFRPVNLAEGPDGALYICDMYRKTIEHPDYLPPEIRKHTDFESGKGMGRIYRVVRSDLNAANRAISSAKPLDDATPAQLCHALHDVRGWTRETARRLLLERHDPAVVPVLKQVLEHASSERQGNTAVAALRLLEALGAVDQELLASALVHDSPGVREQALQLAEARLAASPDLLKGVLWKVKDADPRVRFQCALTLGASSDACVPAALAAIAARGAADRWTRAAVLSSTAGREIEFFEKLLVEPLESSPAQSELLAEVGQLLGASVPAAELPAALRTVVTAIRSKNFEEQAALLAGFSDALRLRNPGKRDAGLQGALRSHFDPQAPEQDFFQQLMAQALRIAQDAQQAVELRSVALKLSADADPAVAGQALVALVAPQQPIEVQAGAVRAIKHLHDPALVARLLEAERFSSFSPSLREEVLSAVFSQPEYLGPLLAALETGAVPVGMIDSLRRTQLTNNRNTAIRERAAKLLAAPVVGDRAKVYEDLKSALDLPPSAEHGRQVFLKVCANCHRLDREGTAVGPDLFGIRNQPKEAILLHILIPEYEITPGFAAYLLETTDGRILAGLLVAETPTRVTLRQALGKEESVLRSDIESLTLSKLSLMPQELEKTLSRQDLADLISYLKGERR